MEGARDWLFRDRTTGRLVIGQPPNLPLMVWVVDLVLRFLLKPTGLPGTILAIVGTAALVVWAVLELVQGVNPFRRILGALVLLGQAAALLHR